MEASAAARKIRYDGSACLNVRSITDALDILSAPPTLAKPITRSEVATALWFVETAVTSSSMFFDGTVPRDTLDEATNAVGKFQRDHEMWTFSVNPIIPGSEHEILRHSTTAARECLLLLKDFELFAGADKAVLASDVLAFRSVLDENYAESELEARALGLATDAFRGSKLLAGLLNAGPDALAAARQAFERYPDRAAIVMGGLINRFRLNYLNQLASSVKGAYLPNLQFEPISNQHARLFKDYLLKKLIEQAPPVADVPNLLAENLHQDVPLPPLGLYALMLTKPSGRPVAILETALERFGDLYSLKKHIAKPTEEGLQLRDPAAPEESLGLIEERFREHYRRIDLEAQGVTKLSGPRKAVVYVIPAILGAVISAATGNVADVIYKVLISAGSSIAMKQLGDLLLTVGVNSYISEYKTLKWDIREDPALKQPLARVAEQVERVFGRPLA